MSGFIKEFKEFAMRGNVVDLAVGIVIGAAFGTIVSSLVNDIIMPPIGLVMGNVDFSDLFINLSAQDYPSLAAAREAGAPVIAYGAFINAVINFVIVAFAIFLVVKAMNRLRRAAGGGARGDPGAAASGDAARGDPRSAEGRDPSADQLRPALAGCGSGVVLDAFGVEAAEVAEELLEDVELVARGRGLAATRLDLAGVVEVVRATSCTTPRSSKVTVTTFWSTTFSW